MLVPPIQPLNCLQSAIVFSKVVSISLENHGNNQLTTIYINDNNLTTSYNGYLYELNKLSKMFDSKKFLLRKNVGFIWRAFVEIRCRGDVLAHSYKVRLKELLVRGPMSVAYH